MTQGKIASDHRSMKSVVKIANDDSPWEFERAIGRDLELIWAPKKSNDPRLFGEEPRPIAGVDAGDPLDWEAELEPSGIKDLADSLVLALHPVGGHGHPLFEVCRCCTLRCTSGTCTSPTGGVSR